MLDVTEQVQAVLRGDNRDTESRGEEEEKEEVEVEVEVEVEEEQINSIAGILSILSMTVLAYGGTCISFSCVVLTKSSHSLPIRSFPASQRNRNNIM